MLKGHSHKGAQAQSRISRAPIYIYYASALFNYHSLGITPRSIANTIANEDSERHHWQGRNETLSNSYHYCFTEIRWFNRKLQHGLYETPVSKTPITNPELPVKQTLTMGPGRTSLDRAYSLFQYAFVLIILHSIGLRGGVWGIRKRHSRQKRKGEISPYHWKVIYYPGPAKPLVTRQRGRKR